MSHIVNKNAVIKILLIEDNPGDSRLLTDMLADAKEASFQFKCATSLSDALDLTENNNFDLVITDLGLPDSQGAITFETLESHLPQTPIVIMTGFDDEFLAADLIEKHAQEYIIKGDLDSRQLIRTLLHAIQRKRSEESEARLAALVRATGDAIIGISPAGKITNWNPGAEEMFGFNKKEAIGNTLDMISPYGLEAKINDVKACSSQASLRFETSCHRKQGNQIDVSMIVSPVKTATGLLLGAAIIAHDITDRVLEENKVRFVADTLQSALLSKKPALDGVDLGVAYQPLDASGAHVGGDFYDFIRIGPGTTAIAIGDVSGKGIKTATTMAAVKYMLRALVDSARGPEDSLEELNRPLYRDVSDESFITVGLGYLDLKQKTFWYASAGHPRPIVCRGNRGCAPLNMLPSRPLCTEPESVFWSQQFELRGIDAIVLYTDGVSEHRDKSGRFFGEQGICTAISAAPNLPAQELAEHILNEATSFSGGRTTDDMAMITIKPIE